MKTFNQLLNESHKGVFCVEPNELTEIHVDYANAKIVVNSYKSANHFLEPIKVEKFINLNGMFGTKTVEQQFNEIIKTK